MRCPPRVSILLPALLSLNIPSQLKYASPFAAPQDLPGALSEAQIAEAMGLHDIKTRPWSIFKTSAIKGDGLFEVCKLKNMFCDRNVPILMLFVCLQQSLAEYSNL